MDDSVALLTDDEILAAYGTTMDPESRGFDEETEKRVLAHKLVRARGRLVYYRSLYAAFVPEGRRYMIESLLDGDDVAGLPVKLAFTDDAEQAYELESDEEVVVWTEDELLDALRRELHIQDYFSELLDELAEA